jgi:transposase-like protein
MLVATVRIVAIIQSGGEIMKYYCPECREKMEQIGSSGCGCVYVCNHCHVEWVLQKRPEGYEEEQN